TADNTNLDPSGSNPGFAVFGVVRSGMDAVNAAYATPVVPQKSPFDSIPLRGGIQPNDPNFPSDTTADNYEIVTAASVTRRTDPRYADALTFAATSSNNGLVTASIDNGKLVLHYVQDQSGSATITVTAT